MHNVVREDSGNSCDSREETVSLTPSMERRMFSYDKGRRYGVGGNSSHFQPNDDEEIYRLGLQHQAVTRALGGVHSIPAESALRVLDSGCGPGWWALEFADAHPNCKVVGIDLVPIQFHDIPPNLSFECDDVCRGLRFPDNSFDVVYSRKLYASLTDWPLYLEELVRVLKPGGRLNCVEPDIVNANYTFSAESAFAQWSAGIAQLLRGLGMRSQAGSELKGLLECAGLEDVQEHGFVVPGSSSICRDAEEQETARLFTEATLMGISAFDQHYGRFNNIHDEELDLFIAEVRRDIMDPDFPWYAIWSSVVGTKG